MARGADGGQAQPGPTIGLGMAPGAGVATRGSVCPAQEFTSQGGGRYAREDHHDQCRSHAKHGNAFPFGKSGATAPRSEFAENYRTRDRLRTDTGCEFPHHV